MILTFAATANTARAAGKDTVGNLVNNAQTDDFARTSFGFYTTGANSSIPYQLNFSDESHIGLCFYFKSNYPANLNDNLHFVKIYDVSGNLVFTVRTSGTSPRIYAHDYTEATSVMSTNYTGLVSGVWLRVDINIKLDAVAGSIDCLIDGTNIYSKSGVDTTKAGVLSAMNQVQLLSGNPTQGLTYPTFEYKSAIVTDGEDTVGLEMHCHTIEADGLHTGLIGTYADVDNLNIDNSNGMIATSGGLKSTVTFSDVPAALDAYDVVGFGMAARCFTSSDVQIGLLATDGTNDLETTPDLYGVQYTPVIKVFPTAPDGTAWTRLQVNALEIGVKTT